MGARIGNDPAVVAISAIDVTVTLRWAATACITPRSRPRLSALTPNPTSAVITASPMKMPRTRNPNVTIAARLSMVAPEVCPCNHPKPARDDFEDARNFSGDFAVERHVHRVGGPNL